MIENSEQEVFDELKYNVSVDETGTKFYRNQKRQLDRGEGPALIFEDGRQIWFQGGMMHREDGPAMIQSSGHCSYYLDNQRYDSKEEYDSKLVELGLAKYDKDGQVVYNHD